MGNFLSNIKKSPTSSSSPSILPFPESDILANSQKNEYYKFHDVDSSNNDVLSEEDVILTLPKPPICEPEPMIELHNSFDNVDDFLPEPQPITEETPVEETPVEETPLEETPLEEIHLEDTPVAVTENVPEPQPEPDDDIDTLPEPQPITNDDNNDNDNGSVLSIDLIHSDSNESLILSDSNDEKLFDSDKSLQSSSDVEDFFNELDKNDEPKEQNDNNNDDSSSSSSGI
jgi:hypothetical protein